MTTKKLLIADKLYRDLHSQSPSPSSSATRPQSGGASRKGKGLPPRLLMCYLCGQQFGTASLEIHQAQCYVKSLLRWERGDPTVRGKRPIPPDEHKAKFGERPVGTGAGGATSQQEMDAYNDQMFEDYNKNALVPCETCGRTFLPDRLQVHMKSCKPGNAARKPPTRATSAGVSRTGGSSSSPVGKRPPPPPRALAQQNEDYEDEINSYRQQQQQSSSSKPLYESPTFVRNQSDATTVQQNDEFPITAGSNRPPPPPRDSDDQQDDYNNDNDNDNSPSSNPQNSLQSRLEARRNARKYAGGGSSGANNNENDNSKPQSVLEAESSMSPSPYNNNNNNRDPIRAVDDRSPPSLQGTLRNVKEQQQSSSSSPSPRPKTASMSRAKSPATGSKPRVTLAERAASDFQRCQYCNRTFAPDRLTKHEDVCLDKYKSSPVNVSSSKPVAKRATTPIKTLSSNNKTTTLSSPRVGTTATTSSGSRVGATTGGAMQHSSLPTALFCEECGNKLQSASKFCSQCGTKVSS